MLPFIRPVSSQTPQQMLIAGTPRDPAIMRQSVKPRVRGCVVRLPRVRKKGRHGRHQREKIKIRQKSVEVLGAPQLGGERAASNRAAADGDGKTVVDSSGSMNDAAYRRPSFGIVTIKECAQRGLVADIDVGHMNGNPFRFQRADSGNPLPYSSCLGRWFPRCRVAAALTVP